MEYVDDASVYNGLRAADISPYVRLDAWLKAQRARKAGGGAAASAATTTTAAAAATTGGIPAFFLISGGWVWVCLFSHTVRPLGGRGG